MNDVQPRLAPLVRDVVLLGLGVVIGLYETFFDRPVRLELIGLCFACLGLPQMFGKGKP